MRSDAISGASVMARILALVFALGVAAGAGMLFLQFGAADGLAGVDILRAALIFGTTFWLGWGAAQSLTGLFWRLDGRPQHPSRDASTDGRTVILLPVYNEDPRTAFARVAAMDASICAAGLREVVDFAILSDTTDDVVAAQERLWLTRLLRDRGADGEGRIFYRRRSRNVGRKAGNIRDFIETSGAAYEYALILDADSLMEGETVAEMRRRMSAEPRLGLLQTLPKIINARSVFGRAMQFAASFYSPVFARGQAVMQGRTGPFWGHNAMVRVTAFAYSCGLPKLSGHPPFGGEILSHDYVEAALLARAGWFVRLDHDLEGSYEEGPEDVIAFAKRDRRWCQGNLQHSRLLAAPGLTGWSRFIFLQGILSYVAPLLWVLFLAANIYASATAPMPDFFPEPYQLFPVFPDDQTSKAIGLAVGIFGLLVLPKFLIAAHHILKGQARAFGGGAGSLRSMLTELALSSLNAPIMLAYQTRSVLQVLTGRDGGWPATQRDAGALRLSEAWMASHWIVLCGALVLSASWLWAPGLFFWLLPVGLPLLLAPWVIWLTSHGGPGPVFAVPSELVEPSIVALHKRIVSDWTGTPSSATADLHGGGLKAGA